MIFENANIHYDIIYCKRSKELDPHLNKIIFPICPSPIGGSLQEICYM